VHPDDPAAYATRLGIPAHVIADLESLHMAAYLRAGLRLFVAG
jgi:hypothetical protein